MYAIGEFAKLSKVSPRMLRHYDKIGLFKPRSVGKNGYRYYNDEDMFVISNIKQLRRYEFSLEDIDKILKKNDGEYTKKMLYEKVDFLRQTTEEYGSLISEIENQIRMVRDDDILSSNIDFDILIGYRKSFLALCIRDRHTTEDNIDDMIDKLYYFIEESNSLVAMGAPLSIFHQSYDEFDSEDTDVEVCIPINREIQNEGILCTRNIKGGTYISTVFTGTYDKLGNAYVSMLKWAKEHGYKIDGENIERYYKDGRDVELQNQFITEICMPVKKQD